MPKPNAAIPNSLAKKYLQIRPCVGCAPPKPCAPTADSRRGSWKPRSLVQVVWGKFQWLMQKGVLDCSGIPLRDFDFVYNYLMYTNVSFVNCFFRFEEVEERSRAAVETSIFNRPRPSHSFLLKSVNFRTMQH